MTEIFGMYPIYKEKISVQHSLICEYRKIFESVEKCEYFETEYKKKVNYCYIFSFNKFLNFVVVSYIIIEK